MEMIIMLQRELIDSLPEYFTHTKQPNSMIIDICAFVLSNLTKDVSLTAVACNLNFSKDYIGRMFKKKTGMSFLQYVTRAKMEYAKKLLASGEYKNYEVSKILGYRTPDYFTQLFKNYTGITPLTYRTTKLTRNFRV